MSRPLLLDAFCCAGGAGMGYARAGFDVIGVDVRAQPHYPFAFVRADALEYIREHGHEFDAIHASPPCQAFTAYRRKGHGVGAGYPDLIAATREALRSTGRPFVIENVPGSPLQASILLCGSSFGLDVRRHRLFESSRLVLAQPCDHAWQTPRFPPATNRSTPRSTVEVGAWRIPLDVQRRAMGIDWMTRAELSEAVPPAYTRYIGAQLISSIERGS